MKFLWMRMVVFAGLLLSSCFSLIFVINSVGVENLTALHYVIGSWVLFSSAVGLTVYVQWMAYEFKRHERDNRGTIQFAETKFGRKK